MSIAEVFFRTCRVVLFLASLPAAGLFAQGSPLAVQHVTLIDMTSSRPKPDITVIIRGTRIEAVGPSRSVAAPKGARVIDGRGKFLIPGLWDMHVHTLQPEWAERLFPLFIANGVTGVRDTGTTEAGFAALPGFRKEVAEGKRVGPRIVAAGRIFDGPRPAVPDNSIPFATEAEARKLVRDMKAGGADFLKVYDGVPRDQYYAIVDEAKKLGIPFAGHVPNAITGAEASDAGQRSFEHLGSIWRDCAGLDQKTIEQRAEALVKPSGKPGDFSHIPGRIAEKTRLTIDSYDAGKCRKLFARFARNKTYQVPTLVTKRAMTLVDDGSFFNDPRMKYVPADDLEDWKPENNFLLKYRTPEFIVQKKRLYQKELEWTAELHKAGVPVMTGTDIPGAYTYPGFSLHDELAMFVQIGFTPFEALKSATRIPAEYLGRLKDLGTIERGKLADLILLDANPLADIANTKRIDSVVANGRYFSKEDRERLLAQVEAAARR